MDFLIASEKDYYVLIEVAKYRCLLANDAELFAFPSCITARRCLTKAAACSSNTARSYIN